MESSYFEGPAIGGPLDATLITELNDTMSITCQNKWKGTYSYSHLYHQWQWEGWTEL